jgi:ABC-2 type transport system permease protein
MRTLLHIAGREVRAILRDRWTAIAVFVVPALIGPLLAFIYTARTLTDIPTVIVDRDGSAGARALARMIDAHEGLAVIRTIADDAAIEDLLRSGDASCVIRIPPGFERTLKRGGRTDVVCLINGTNMVVANAALKAATASVGTFSAGIGLEKARKAGVPSAQAATSTTPVSVSPRLLFNPAQSYSNFFVPGILAALLQQVVVIGAALTWVREFRTGEIHDLVALTRSPWLLTAGKLVVYAGIGCGWGVVYFVGLFALLGIPYTGSVIGGVAAVTAMVVAMALAAMIISVLNTHRETAIQMAFIVSSPAFLLSGYTFPHMAMHGIARVAGEIIPLTPFLAAWRRLVLYGAGCEDIVGPMATLVILILLAGGAVVLLVGRRIARLSLEPGKAQ